MKAKYLFKLNFLLSSYNFPLIVGICVGIAASLVFTPPFSLTCVKHNSQFSNSVRLPSLRDIRSNGMDLEDEDIELSLNMNENIEVNKNGEVHKDTSKLKRPRYYSTELGMKDKVLVSVISSTDSVSSFGIALNKTLNHYVDKLIFFVDGIGSKKLGLHIPIVGFRESKPLIKIFRVISYINENYIEDYNYFMFVTDHTYINGNNLMSLLEKISVNLNVHMGIVQDNGDSFYCSLDSGIILSQSVLEAVGKELLWCTKHSFSDSDSDNLGRCILHASNIPCTSIFQDQIFISYTFQDEEENWSSFLALTKLLDSNFASALTVRIPKQSIDFYELHIYFLKKFVVQMEGKIKLLREEIVQAVKASPQNTFSSWPIGSSNPHIPQGRSDVIKWETFNATHLFMPNDFENVIPLSTTDLQDVMSIADVGVAHLKTESEKSSLSLEGFRYGHKRYDPTRGMDYILSLTFKDSNGKHLYRSIEAFRGLTQPEIIPMPYVTESTRVNIVLFIQTSDVEAAEIFLTRFLENVRIEHITLILHLLFDKGESYLGKDDPYKDLKKQLKMFTKRCYNAESRATFSHIIVPQGKPSTMALFDLALSKLPADDLVLFVDPRANFKEDFVNRVRMNTIKNWQVFIPIPFTLFHPNLVSDKKSYLRDDVTRDNGHFDKFDFSTISLYAEDYLQARKSISKSIPLFRSEKDLVNDCKSSSPTVYNLLMNTTDLHVLRGSEPSLVMQYTDIECVSADENTSNFARKMACEAQRSNSLGTRLALSHLVSSFDKSRRKGSHSGGNFEQPPN